MPPSRMHGVSYNWMNIAGAFSPDNETIHFQHCEIPIKHSNKAGVAKKDEPTHSNLAK